MSEPYPSQLRLKYKNQVYVLDKSDVNGLYANGDWYNNQGDYPYWSNWSPVTALPNVDLDADKWKALLCVKMVAMDEPIWVLYLGGYQGTSDNAYWKGPFTGIFDPAQGEETVYVYDPNVDPPEPGPGPVPGPDEYYAPPDAQMLLAMMQDNDINATASEDNKQSIVHPLNVTQTEVAAYVELNHPDYELVEVELASYAGPSIKSGLDIPEHTFDTGMLNPSDIIEGNGSGKLFIAAEVGDTEPDFSLPSTVAVAVAKLRHKETKEEAMIFWCIDKEGTEYKLTPEFLPYSYQALEWPIDADSVCGMWFNYAWYSVFKYNQEKFDGDVLCAGVYYGVMCIQDGGTNAFLDTPVEYYAVYTFKLGEDNAAVAVTEDAGVVQVVNVYAGEDIPVFMGATQFPDSME